MLKNNPYYRYKPGSIKASPARLYKSLKDRADSIVNKAATSPKYTESR